MEETVKVEHLVAVVNFLTVVGVQQAIVETVDSRHQAWYEGAGVTHTHH